jgi:hypothetical protein
MPTTPRRGEAITARATFAASVARRAVARVATDGRMGVRTPNVRIVFESCA